MRALLAVIAVASGCGPRPPAQLRARAQPQHGTLVHVDAKGVFTFDAPAPVRELRTRGIDSLVGKYEMLGCQLSFDFGDYSNGLAPWDLVWPDDYRYRVGTLDGRPARWAMWTESDPEDHRGSRVALHVHGAGLTVSARCPTAEAVQSVVGVLESIRLSRVTATDERVPPPHGPATWSAPVDQCAVTTTPGSDRLEVVVRDANDRALPDVFVGSDPLPDGSLLGELTNRSGVAMFPAVAAGRYTLTASVALTRSTNGVTVTEVGLTVEGGICRGVRVGHGVTHLELHVDRF